MKRVLSAIFNFIWFLATPAIGAFLLGVGLRYKLQGKGSVREGVMVFIDSIPASAKEATE